MSDQAARVGRRTVLAGAAAVTVAGTVGAVPGLSSAARGSGPHVVVVGAGLAGLTCADVLHRAGVRVSLYEARPERLGGRCWSSYGWRAGQVGEHGGEFIDTRHAHIRALVDRFRLRLEDTWAGGAGGSGRLWLDGGLRRPADLRATERVFARRIRRLRERIGAYTWPHATDAARAVDEMTARDVIDRYLPGGSRGLAGRRWNTHLASYLGLDADRLSGLAVVDTIDQSPGADERYHVRGGNGLLVEGLAAALPRRVVTTDSPLRRLRRRPDGTYALRIGGRPGEVVADRVVLCLPFPALREVDLDGAGLSAHTRRCIERLGMGTNAKVMMQFAGRPQAYGGWNGLLRSDAPALDTWESSAAQPGATGLVTVYLGGRSGAGALPGDPVHGPAPAQLADRMLAALVHRGQTRLPGLRAGFLGRASLDHWSRDRWTGGSYAAFLPGQYTRFAGFVGRADGGVHFAGEHTAPLVDQGYLNGAVRSGERAAREVLAAVSRPAPR